MRLNERHIARSAKTRQAFSGVAELLDKVAQGIAPFVKMGERIDRLVAGTAGFARTAQGQPDDESIIKQQLKTLAIQLGLLNRAAKQVDLRDLMKKVSQHKLVVAGKSLSDLADLLEGVKDPLSKRRGPSDREKLQKLTVGQLQLFLINLGEDKLKVTRHRTKTALIPRILDRVEALRKKGETVIIPKGGRKGFFEMHAVKDSLERETLFESLANAKNPIYNFKNYELEFVEGDPLARMPWQNRDHWRMRWTGSGKLPKKISLDGVHLGGPGMMGDPPQWTEKSGEQYRTGKDAMGGLPNLLRSILMGKWIGPRIEKGKTVRVMAEVSPGKGEVYLFPVKTKADQQRAWSWYRGDNRNWTWFGGPSVPGGMAKSQKDITFQPRNMAGLEWLEKRIASGKVTKA